jgi:hypothetical protein
VADEADALPLAEALSKIDDILLSSESDPSLMLDQLNAIIDTAEAGKKAYLANRMAAQREELEALRAKVGNQ